LIREQEYNKGEEEGVGTFIDRHFIDGHFIDRFR